MVVLALHTACRANSTATGITTAGSTQFTYVANTLLIYTTTEAHREITTRSAGIYTKLYTRILANSTSGSSTVNIRKNGANPGSGLSITIGAAATGVFEDATNSVTAADGDEINYQLVTGAAGTMTVSLISVLFEASSGSCISKLVTQAYALTAASVTHFLPVAGNRSTITATEANTENTVKIAGIAKNASLLVTSNARTTSTTSTLRKNRADTAITMTIGAGATGIFEDTTNDVSYADDDEIDWAVTSGSGTETLTFIHISLDYETSTQNGFITAGAQGSAADITLAPSITNYFVVGGAMIEGTTTETQAQLKPRVAIKVKRLTAYAKSNTITAGSIIKLRINAADGAQSLTIPASTTGSFSDIINVDTLAATDLICYEVITGATGTTLNLEQLALWTDTTQNIEKTLSDTKTIGETSFTRLKAAKKILSETETIGAGTVARINAFFASIAAQTITISDGVTKLRAHPGILKTLTDTIVISEVRARLKAVWRYQP